MDKYRIALAAEEQPAQSSGFREAHPLHGN